MELISNLWNQLFLYLINVFMIKYTLVVPRIVYNDLGNFPDIFSLTFELSVATSQ